MTKYMRGDAIDEFLVALIIVGVIVLVIAVFWSREPSDKLSVERRLQAQEQREDAALIPVIRDDRIKVVRVGVFRDDLAYSGQRGIYMISDQRTGVEYVGISGIGISEAGSHLFGKTRRDDDR